MGGVPGGGQGVPFPGVGDHRRPVASLGVGYSHVVGPADLRGGVGGRRSLRCVGVMRRGRCEPQRQAGLVHKFRLAMMTGGVDFSGSPGGITSAMHDEAELDDTLTALRKAIRMLKQEGEI